jgi:pectin methylesterase-like acyl-CoA thioesterase
MKNFNSFRIRLLLVFALFLSSTFTYAYDLVVAQDGSGNYTTVQAAINAAPSNSIVPYTIFIKNGKYREKITVPSTKPFLQLTGESVAGVFVYYDDPATILGTQNSASFTINANDFAAVNITFANTFNYDSASAAGQAGLQAVAVLVNADRAAFKNCRFLGNQDTLYTKGSGTPRHYFKNCYIDGIIDFIFGSSVAVFDSCVIYPKARTASGSSYITAANTPSGQTYGYVFRDCRFPANNGTTTYYLGRPWQNSTGSVPLAENKVTILNSRLSDKIRPEGWTTWDAGTNTSLISYNEYNSRYFNGALVDVSQRVAWSNQLNSTQAATYNNTNLFGSWDPCSVMAGFCNNTTTDIAVANFKGTKGNPNSTFTWNISWPLDQIKYELFRSTTTRNGVYAKLSEVTATNDTAINFSLTDANPPSGSIYYYYILASKSGYSSSYTDTVQISSAPTINVAANLSPFFQTVGAPSATQTYTVSGTDLQGDVTITPPANYEVSNNGGTNWYTNASPLTLTQTGGTIASTTITVRLNASSANTYAGNIVHTSTNASSVSVAVTGTTTNAPSINSVTLIQYPFTLNNQDSASIRSAGVAARIPSLNNLTVSNGSPIAPYSTAYGQAFGMSTNGDATWTTGSGNLNRTVYEQFVVKPTSGYSLRIDSVVVNSAFYLTGSSLRMAVGYSKSNFTTNDSAEITGGTNAGATLTTATNGTFSKSFTITRQDANNTTPASNYRLALNGTTGITLAPTDSLVVRIYMATGSTGTPRYGFLRDMIVKGEITSSPLPVNLISFTASYNGTTTDLVWSTANEVNAKSFVIERGVNAKDFISIGTVFAKNSVQAEYRFADKNPVAGANYYRLKMIDVDGSFKYSNVIVINTKFLSGITIYPNPVISSFLLSHDKAGKDAVVEIYAADGKKVLRQAIEFSSTQTDVDASQLVKGTYLVIYSDGINKTSSKFIKQ